MKEIKKSYLQVIVSVWWGWIFIFIPNLIFLLKIMCEKYSYDDDNIYITIGILNKTQKTIPFYRIIDITANQNIFNYGKLIIRDKKKVVIIENVEAPIDVSNQLLKYVAKGKENNIRNEVI